MKKFVLFFICICLINTGLKAQSNQLSKESAWRIVLKDILKENTENINVYVYDSIQPSNKEISTIKGESFLLKNNSWVFFIDDLPYESWQHPCRYIFVNTTNGEYEIHSNNLPPKLSEMSTIVEKKDFECERNLFKITPNKSFPKMRSNNDSQAGHQYAVIISGGIDSDNNHIRYWNDCSAMYNALVNIYGFPKSNIYVLMSDGTDPGLDLRLKNGVKISSPLDLDNDGENDIQYAATRTAISGVFNTLSATLTNEDNLFIFTMDHGGQAYNQTVYLCLWNYEFLYDYEFSSYINQINANKIMICMGQCHSGGFIDNLANNDNVVISTACKYDESSYSRVGNLYDEYVYHWISAITGNTPEGTTVNADTNLDDFVSLYEAFSYANNHDSQNEHPQYMANPLLLGRYSNAAGDVKYEISGPNNHYGTNVFYIPYLPDGYTVTWSFTPGDASSSSWTLQQNTPSANRCTLTCTQSIIHGCYLVARIYNSNSTLVKVIQKDLSNHVFSLGTYSLYDNFHTVPQHIPTTSFSSEDHLIVISKCNITINFNVSGLSNLTHTGNNLNTWSDNGQGTVVLRFPYSKTQWQYQTISGTCDNGYFEFYLDCKPDKGSLDDEPVIDLAYNGETLNIVIIEGEEEEEQEIDNLQYSTNSTSTKQGTWNVTIANAITGRVAYSGRINGNTMDISTAGWTKGMYVVRVQDKEYALSEKIIID